MPRGRGGRSRKIKDAVARRGARGKSSEKKLENKTRRFKRYQDRAASGKKWSYEDFGRKFGTRGNR